MNFDPNGGVLVTSDRFRCGNRSNFGWNPRRSKIAVWREIIPVTVHKNTQEERKQRFRFLYNTIFSKLLFLSNYIRIYRTVQNTKRKKKVLGNVFVRLEMWQIKQNVQGRRLSFLGYLKENICSSRLLLRTLSSGLIWTSLEILGLSSILGWVLHWPFLCLSWSLFSRLPWSDLYSSMDHAPCLYKLGAEFRQPVGTPMHNHM